MFQKIINFINSILGRARSVYVEASPKISIPSVDNSPWLTIARKEVGIKEYLPGDNPRIIEYHKATKLAAVTDEVPWCSAFVCWCLEKSGHESTHSASARSFLKWGVALEKPEIGCIVIFDRGNGMGHVGFYMGEEDRGIFVLGGNQSNCVNISMYNKSKLLGYRWPSAT